MQLPQIPTGPAPVVAWDPDDHVWRLIAGTGPGQIRPYESTNVPPTPVTAATWTDVIMPDLQIPAGTAMMWAKLIVHDTSGASNTIQSRLYIPAGFPSGFSVMDSSIITVPANGYGTMFLMQNEATNAQVTLRLGVYGTGAFSVTGPSGQPDTPQYAMMLGLWLYPIGV